MGARGKLGECAIARVSCESEDMYEWLPAISNNRWVLWVRAALLVKLLLLFWWSISLKAIPSSGKMHVFLPGYHHCSRRQPGVVSRVGIISQNHSMVKIERDLLRLCDPTSLLSQRCPEQFAPGLCLNDF